jgi:hypothetical protein
MSIILKNLISSRSQIVRSSSRHLSHFRGNGSHNQNRFYKWYLLLGSGGLFVGYFALKSFKVNWNKIYALQQRKVSSHLTVFYNIFRDSRDCQINSCAIKKILRLKKAEKNVNFLLFPLACRMGRA